MGRAIELITVQATAPGTSFTAFSAVSGNSLTVRDTGKPVNMLSLFSTRQGAGAIRITSPVMHDTSVGLQLLCSSANRSMITFDSYPQPMQSQDVPTVTGTGSATAGDIESSSYILLYDDLPGVDGRFADWQTVERRVRNIFSNSITVATGTAGGYSGSVAVNSAQDQFKANTDYALLGYTVSSNACHAVRFVGTDWGNLGVGGPGFLQSANDRTDNWFVQLSHAFGRTIPIMSSVNKGLTTIDCAQDENGTDPVVTITWAELGR